MHDLLWLHQLAFLGGLCICFADLLALSNGTQQQLCLVLDGIHLCRKNSVKSKQV